MKGIISVRDRFKNLITWFSALPGKVTEEAYNMLKNKPADEFDKEYYYVLETAHNRAIALFEEASEESTDGDIKTMAGNMLTDFDTHLYHIVACLNKLEAKTK